MKAKFIQNKRPVFPSNKFVECFNILNLSFLSFTIHYTDPSGVNYSIRKILFRL